jgi:1,4-dihydroxy-2-naphthoyl-CoA hydrolase
VTDMKTNTRIRLRDTDAAGLLFFANQFTFMHDAYELLMESVGFPLIRILTEEDFALPIVHAESDYMRKLEVGDELEIQVKVATIGTSSFTLSYEMLLSNGDVAGRGETVHVSVDRTSNKKVVLPGALRQALKHFMSQS